ncbi:MAG: AAA family ATPase [Prevotella sp.]|nr:AAA family ATPase [Prevotella sp.]
MMDAYTPETIDDFYNELLIAMRKAPDYEAVYRSMSFTYHKFIDLNTKFETINFAGAFAKTDFLLKKSGARQLLQREVNGARVRMRAWGNGDATKEQLSDNYAYDFKALCSFFSLVSGKDVPDDLRKLYPQPRAVEAVEMPISDCMRLIVSRWDDDFVYGHIDNPDAAETKVCYNYKNKLYPYDWTYLRSYFYDGAQLNLIRPRQEEGVLFPELIIFEPDYLVDISSIAACFEEYGESPMVYLLNQLKPSASSIPILLGNLAGQLLDEEISLDSTKQAYRDSVQKFFNSNAISMLNLLGTPHDSAEFHSMALAQKKNIHRAFAELQQKGNGAFKRDDVVLEPSFYCQMLGLQGRMDLLQLDYKFLVEQKSGKCAWPEPQRAGEAPMPQTKHYVQLLLYGLIIRYNFHDQYKRNQHSLDTFLLYSRYVEALCGVGSSPELVFRALRLRNAIALRDIMYTKEGFSFLDKVSADSLNINHVNGKLWQMYQKPQIEDILSPLHNASPLEKAYYYRFQKFLATEHRLSKIGNKNKEGSGFAAMWLNTLDEKLQAGNIYHNMTLAEPSANHEGCVKTVVLRFSEQRSNDMSNFRKGDIVVLYSYRAVPDACKTMVIRCSIADIATDSITLQLRAVQSDSRVFRYFDGYKWAIEHDFMESSFTTLYRGMHSFLSAPKERRDLILLQRRPEVDSSVSLNGDYGSFNEMALRVKQAKDLFLIIGPPGTGKTSFGMLNTLKEQLTEEHTSILLLSYTNRAVDEMCGKLIEEGIDFIRIGRRISSSEESVPYLLESKVAECGNINEVRHLIDSTRVFAATTTTMLSNMPVFERKTFDLAIVDEASQILEPHLMGLLSATNDSGAAIRKFVFIGDHKQLPAVVQQTEAESAVSDAQLRGIGLIDCRLSLFERLLSRYRDDAEVVYMLTRQGRMHHDIAEFPNQMFYGRKLDVVPLAHQLSPLPDVNTDGLDELEKMIYSRRVSFIDVALPSDEEYVSDKVNQPEADIIAQIVYDVYKKVGAENFDPVKTIGVIVPYRNQIATIRNTIDARYGISELRDITIDTVERYQGSQRDYIVYGFTVQKYYQLEFLTNNTFIEDGKIIDRKLNVAMTRAREHLFLIGNARLLRRNYLFSEMIDKLG